MPHERCDLSAILSWYDLRRIFPQGGRRTTLQGGFRKEVGRKKVAFGHYSPIQYTIRIYVVSTIYCMYIMLYYTIYCYRVRMDGGKPPLSPKLSYEFRSPATKGRQGCHRASPCQSWYMSPILASSARTGRTAYIETYP